MIKVHFIPLILFIVFLTPSLALSSMAEKTQEEILTETAREMLECPHDTIRVIPSSIEKGQGSIWNPKLLLTAGKLQGCHKEVSFYANNEGYFQYKNVRAIPNTANSAYISPLIGPQE